MEWTFSFRSTRPALTFSVALVLGAAAACGPQGGERAEPPASAPAATAPSAPAGPPASPAPAVAGFDRLQGRWLRPDGGYFLEIRSISPEGKVEASYLNPRPVNVARAEALREGGVLSLFVELRDVNYPGSTYKLIYDPARDVLGGLYYQALQQQTFDVEFVRR